MTQARSIVIHGHFYQPPREDPWLGEVEAEPSAAPFHDWNDRIDHECYRPVTAARILGAEGRIVRIVNTLSWISYDVGPTLLNWMERESPATYETFLKADGEARRRTGFGNALAHPYHHVILPLCTRRDKITEVRWGIADFRRRFSRDPEGMWLPEAAVDDETLEVLAEEGIQFTVVGPAQVEKIPAGGLPGRVKTGGGRSIAVFVYDGPLSHDVAFGPLLRDSKLWAERLLAVEPKPRSLVSLATDGETWGHHHKFGEMALAAVLERLRATAGITVDSFAGFLAKHPPAEDLSIVSPSSWSCPHGVDRWQKDCGCKIAPNIPSQQEWRAPLRDGMNWLAEELHGIFEREGKASFGDPWQARDQSGGVAGVEDSTDVRDRELLEMERNALAMFTSCGWFFDDVADIASLVVMRHAARALELAGSEAKRLEEGLLRYLVLAKSNDPGVGDAAQLYRGRIRERPRAEFRAAGGYAGLRTLDPDANTPLAGYRFNGNRDAVTVEDRRTGRTESVPVTVDRVATGELRVKAAGEPLLFRDLPEPHQVAIRERLARDIAQKWFSPATIEAMVYQGKDVDGLAREALIDATGTLMSKGTAELMEQVNDLLDLLDLLGDKVPWEAQTRFYESWSGASDTVRARLATLAPRFGFAA